jgi:hypothetical protein
MFVCDTDGMMLSDPVYVLIPKRTATEHRATRTTAATSFRTNKIPAAEFVEMDFLLT